MPVSPPVLCHFNASQLGSDQLSGLAVESPPLRLVGGGESILGQVIPKTVEMVPSPPCLAVSIQGWNWGGWISQWRGRGLDLVCVRCADPSNRPRLWKEAVSEGRADSCICISASSSHIPGAPPPSSVCSFHQLIYSSAPSLIKYCLSFFFFL